MSHDADFFTSYKSISNKLKKRFMKKPNVAEASEEFSQLAKSLKSSGSFAYGGYCCLTAARCEQTMVNRGGEIMSFIEAGKCFIVAQKLVNLLGTPHCSEHVCATKNACDLAIKACISKYMVTEVGSQCWEIGNVFENQGQMNEAAVQYKQAVDLSCHNPLQLVLSLNKMLKLMILLEEYHSALLYGTEILDQLRKRATSEEARNLFGYFTQLHCETEITVVLLLMLLNFHPSKMKEKHAMVLQKYTWPDEKAETSAGLSAAMDNDLFLMLQSLVMACSAKDLDSIKYLQKELRSSLAVCQNELLEKIVSEFEHPSGIGF